MELYFNFSTGHIVTVTTSEIIFWDLQSRSLFKRIPVGGDLSAARFTGSRIFLDLNTHNQMRTIVDSKDARNSHVGTIELVELQKVDLVDLPVPPTGNERMRNSKQALSISTAESTCLLVVEDQKIVKQWSEQLDKAHEAFTEAQVCTSY